MMSFDLGVKGVEVLVVVLHELHKGFLFDFDG